MNTGEATRTPDLRIMRPRKRKSKALQDKSLGEDAPSLAHHLPTDTCRLNPDLAIVIETWEKLPEPVRAGIVAMVKATSGI
jgi:hypothetical protein